MDKPDQINSEARADSSLQSVLTVPVTPDELVRTTWLFILLACLGAVPLTTGSFHQLAGASWWMLFSTAGFFWGLLTALAFTFAWSAYYAHFYPPWLRKLGVVNIALYGFLAVLMWFLADLLPGNRVLTFLLLGGVEGVAEHALAIYRMNILDKVPWLEGLSSRAILVFSFVEYVFYWSLVVWLIVLLQALGMA